MIILPEKIEEEKPKQIRTKGKETTIKIVLQQFQKMKLLKRKRRDLLRVRIESEFGEG